jgi:predicted alpha/beta superfamily hydrolase
MLHKKDSFMPRVIIIVISILFCCTNLLLGQHPDTGHFVGQTVEIYSNILKEKREIYIYTPVDYHQPENRYPVLYVLDGEVNFFFSAAVVNFLSRSQRIPRMIVVGIPNTDRTRDFTPTHTSQRQNSGGANKFLDFLGEELFPYIDNTYRTHPYRILFGHSLCGMFSIYTLFTKPYMLNSILAGSPGLMYDNEFVTDTIESILDVNNSFDNSLYITLGDEPAYTNSLTKLSEILSSKTQNLNWVLSIRENEDHRSVPLKTLYDGLEFIYSDWQPSEDLVYNGAQAIKDHYDLLSTRYGFPIIIPEMNLNMIGYQLLQSGDVAKAIEVFEYNIELYPNSANVYDSYAEALENNSELDKAAKNYKIAVQIGKEINDPNLNIYESNLARVEEQIK